MKRFATVVSGLAGALLLLGPMVKEAVAFDGKDVIGTWKGTAATKCSGLVNGTAPAGIGIDTTVQITAVPLGSTTPTALNISVTLSPPTTPPAVDIGLDLTGTHLYHGEFLQKSKKPKSALIPVAGCVTAASLGDLSGMVGEFTVGPNKATPPVVELNGTLISEDDTTSPAGTTSIHCSVKGLTRTIPTDPGLTDCTGH